MVLYVINDMAVSDLYWMKYVWMEGQIWLCFTFYYAFSPHLMCVCVLSFYMGGFFPYGSLVPYLALCAMGTLCHGRWQVWTTEEKLTVAADVTPVAPVGAVPDTPVTAVLTPGAAPVVAAVGCAAVVAPVPAAAVVAPDTCVVTPEAGCDAVTPPVAVPVAAVVAPGPCGRENKGNWRKRISKHGKRPNNDNSNCDWINPFLVSVFRQ